MSFLLECDVDYYVYLKIKIIKKKKHLCLSFHVHSFKNLHFITFFEKDFDTLCSFFFLNRQEKNRKKSPA